MSNYSLAVVGGSGNITNIDPHREPLFEALTEAENQLRRGGSAIEAVLRAVTILEDHPRLNAGYGSAPNEDGGLQMEAAIMSGSDLSAGAVAGIDCITNPIHLAELIRRQLDVVKLVGRGAVRFALESGMTLIDPSQLITERQARRLARQRANSSLIIDGDEEKLGTVGAVAMDTYGNLAAATSTGGLLGARAGRVADTSTIGAGTYANRHAAISGTGRGEDFIRNHVAGNIASLARSGMPILEATQKVMAELDDFGGKGGVIAVNHLDAIGVAKTDSVMSIVHGITTGDSPARIGLNPAETQILPN